MKYRIILLTIVFIMSSKSALAAAQITGSGFGEAGTNQCFYDVSMDCGGFPSWISEDGTQHVVYSAGYYRVTDTLECPNAGGNTIYYYNNTNDPTVGSWSVNAGSSPGGSFTTAGTCGAAPPTPPAQTGQITVNFDTATTTCVVIDASTTECYSVGGTRSVDNPTQDLFMGYILFFITGGGVIWFFRKK